MGIKERAARKMAQKTAIKDKKRIIKLKRASVDILNLKRLTHLKKFLNKEIIPLISFAHTISVSWRNGKHYLTIRGKEKISIKIMGAQMGAIMDMFDAVREFFRDYSTSATYQLAVSGRSDWHEGIISFQPEISIGAKNGHCDEKIAGWFKTALDRLEEIINKQ
jgi:hypothetical protein